ncbi:hypothetical protein TNCV_1208341 [Trichonephila clavipes]|nr:hypothetical protein TNCV_1208341 [Trichonephila clavipes]
MGQLQTQSLIVWCEGDPALRHPLARNPRCSRHRIIDEVDITTPVAVNQRAANCLEELYGHSLPCGALIDCFTLTSPSVVHCQFLELVGTLRSTASKLTLLLELIHCKRVPIA